jgi:hypothetical protein
MAMIIEDGTGVAGADSYATRAAYIAYVLSWYGDVVADTDALDPPIRRATAYMSGLAWKGTRTLGRAQSLAWPRTGVVDCEGLSLGDAEIPLDLIYAQHELARAELTSPGVLTPAVSKANATVVREKVDLLEVEYDTDNLTGSIDEVRPIVTAAMDRLKCYLSASGRVLPAAMVV